MRRHLALAFGLALVLVPATARAEVIEGRATVSDGDTITLDGIVGRIRIHGIDAPEGSQRCTDGEGVEFRCGARSADALASIIGSSAEVSCEVTDVDRWNRTVALCRTPAGVDIAGELVRQGWAIDYTRYSDGLYQGQEREARRASRGIWAGEFTEPEEWRRQRR